MKISELMTYCCLLLTGDELLFAVDGQKLVPVLEVPPKWNLVKVNILILQHHHIVLC